MLKNQYIRPYSVFSITILLILFTLNLKAGNLTQVVNLKGIWKFSIGDNPAWSDSNFDDSNWQNIRVPNPWESEGFNKYNGFAWYRTKFEFPENINNNYVYLSLGYIDDADEVYVNGKLIGSYGSLTPPVKTAFDVLRQYTIPADFLNKKGKNTIAVRVYDYYNQGGITHGPIGIYTDNSINLLALNLSGYWEFETEQEFNNRLKAKSSKTINKQFVPGYWESNGYQNYDGKARYKTAFFCNDIQLNKNLYLILGFIDDIEVVYLNGVKIGSVIALEKEEKTNLHYDIIFRAYKIPENLLKKDAENIISVVVYDKGGLGGIYKGPIGIATETNYLTLKATNTLRKGFFEMFLNSIKL